MSNAGNGKERTVAANGKAPKRAAGPAAGSGQAESNPEAQRAGGSLNRLELVRGMILKCSEQVGSGKPNRTGVAELIRLLALEKELADNDRNVQEIKVTWVEPKAAESWKSE